MLLRSTESKVFHPPWTHYDFHTRRTPHMLSPHGNCPVAWLPIPRPLSLPPLLHYLYFGDLDALADYLRNGPPVESVFEPKVASGSVSRIGKGRTASITLPLQALDTLSSISSTSTLGLSIPPPTPPLSPGTRSLPRRRPPPLSLSKSPPLAAWGGFPISPTGARMVITLENSHSFESRWTDVFLNLHYLGLSITLRQWLQWLWRSEQPGKPEPMINGDTDRLLYDTPPILPRSPHENCSSEEEAKVPSTRLPFGRHRRHDSWDRRSPISPSGEGAKSSSSRPRSPIIGSPRGRSPRPQSPHVSGSSHPYRYLPQ